MQTKEIQNFLKLLIISQLKIYKIKRATKDTKTNVQCFLVSRPPHMYNQYDRKVTRECTHGKSLRRI